MKITRGKKVKPYAVLIYGVEGVGKTNLLKDNPNTIFIGPEENDEVEADRLDIMRTKLDVENQLSWLVKGEHDYKTVFFDGFDLVESIYAKHILSRAKNKGKSMEQAEGGYGKAWKEVEECFINLKNYLIDIREKRGMNIVLSCHNAKTKHEDPMTQTSYDVYAPSFHKYVLPHIKAWVSGIFFINYKRALDSDDKIVDMNKRVIFTEERASHIAKNRWNLPYEITYKKEGTWEEILGLIAKHYKTGKVSEPVKTKPVKEVKKDFTHLVDKIELLSEELPAAKKQAAIKFAAENKDNEANLKNMIKRLKEI